MELSENDINELLGDPIVEESSTPEQVETPDFKLNPLPEISDGVSRFSGADWFKEVDNADVTLAGLGGIGSWAGLLLARLGINSLSLYDNDTVEAANRSGQLYGENELRSTKASALYRIIMNFTGNSVRTYARDSLWSRDTGTASPIMICGFDNMNSRREYFQSWKKLAERSPNKDQLLFIDGRLNFNEFQIYCLTGNDTYNIEKYEKECLFDDSEAENVVCSLKQTSHCAAMIGSMITNLFVNFISNKSSEDSYKQLPFKTYYNSDMMLLTTEL